MNKNILIVLISALPCVGSFSQTASFIGLGDLPGGDFNSDVKGISNDGSVIVGMGNTDDGNQTYIWKEGTGITGLANTFDSSYNESWPDKVSGDGTVIIGAAGTYYTWDHMKAYRWNQSEGMVSLGSLDGSERSEAHDASEDGSVIVGDGGIQAFRWTLGTGMVGLGYLDGKNRSYALAVSRDGKVVTGSSFINSFSFEESFIWTQETGMQRLNGYLTGQVSNFPNSLSPDGSAIAGSSYDTITWAETPFIWTKAKGMVSIGHLPGKSTTHPMSISDSGKIIVGGSYSGMTDNGLAFIWDKTHGIRNLKTVLVSEYGLNLDGWTLYNASRITPDGKFIAGWGKNPSGKQEAFRAVLGSPVTNVKTTNKKEDGIKIYPNPITNKVTISLSSNLSLVKIYNLQGIQVFSKIYQNATSETIDLTGNAKGIYLARVITDGGYYEEKIVKE